MLALEGAFGVVSGMEDSKASRQHHVRMVVGITAPYAHRLLSDAMPRGAPGDIERALNDLAKIDETVASIPGLSLVGVSAGEFTSWDGLDIEGEAFRRRAHFASARKLFEQRIRKWFAGRLGIRNPLFRPAVVDTFVEKAMDACTSYTVVVSSYSDVMEKPDAVLPESVAEKLKRMTSVKLLEILLWIARKLYGRDKITRSLMERIEFEAKPRPKKRKRRGMEW